MRTPRPWTRYNVWLPNDQIAALKKRSESTGLTSSEMIRESILYYLTHTISLPTNCMPAPPEEEKEEAQLVLNFDGRLSTLR